MDELDKKVLSEIKSEIPEKSLGITAKSGQLSPEEEAIISQDANLERAYGDSAATAAALGATRGLSFGLSDQFLVKSGLANADQLKEIKERNELASLTGEAAGTIAPLLVPGGAATAPGAIAKVSTLAEKSLAKVLAEQGSKSIAKSIVAKTLPKAAGSAVEGAAYGIGQLISEDALGTSKLNAENALANAGIGALLGGSVGGLFAAPASLLPIVEKGASKIKSTATSKFAKATDPAEAALDLYGFTPTQRAKLKAKNAAFVEDLPQWTADKAKLGIFTNSEKLRNNLQELKINSGNKISSIISTIDNIAEKEAGILPSAKSVYAGIASNIDSTILQEYKNIPGYKSQLAPVKDLKSEFIELAKQPGDVKVKDLHNLRQKIDSLIKFDKQPGTYTLKEKALNDIRHLLNDEISNLAEKATLADKQKSFGSLLDELKQANKDYSYVSRILPNIDKKIEKDSAKKALGISDMLAIGSGEILHEGLGGLAVLGKKFLESDLRRRVTILSAIEKQNKQTENFIKSSVEDFLKSKKFINAAKSGTSSILIKSKFSEDSKNRRPTSKEDAFKNLSERIAEYTANPEKLEKILTTRMFGLNQAAPNTALEVSSTAVKGLTFLNSKLPKPAADLVNKNIFTKRTYKPSEIELSKFSRYLEAVENPLSAISDLKNGTLTSEKVEAVKEVYPELYAKMQQMTMESVQNSKEQIPYNKRLQLGILLDIPTDESLKPENIAGLQTSFVNLPEKAPTKNARAESLSMADRTQTEANKIAQQ